ncbi:MAG: glycerate kinase, partial [Pseudobutyrivibrio sp.]|nr:glycerate kinase [Pseudobutyrivibrio sp.]
MKMLFASDSFKGSITSEKTIELLSKAANEVFGDCEVMGVPVADGGEGTVDAVIKAENGQLLSRKVKDPLWNEVDASYGVFRDCAIIEMATASGLPLVPTQYRNPMDTTTYGTGELILDAINKGYRNIYIAIGGSATNDGGMGCARALGIRFFDNEGHELEGIGRDLINVATIDTSCMDTRIKECTITVMCDVKNPLCGPNGATYTYGPQKGLSADDIDILEEGMCNYRDVIKEQFNVDCDSIEGAGAAGGLG